MGGGCSKARTHIDTQLFIMCKDSVVFQMLRRSSGMMASSMDVCEMFGIVGIPMIVVVHPDGTYYKHYIFLLQKVQVFEMYR